MKFRIKSITEHGDEYISEEVYSLEELEQIYSEGEDVYMGRIGESVIIKQELIDAVDGYKRIDQVVSKRRCPNE